MVRAIAQKKSHLRNCRRPFGRDQVLTPYSYRLKDFQDPQESLRKGETRQRVSFWRPPCVNHLQIIGSRSLELTASRTRERCGESNLPLPRSGMENSSINHKFLINRKAARQLLTLDEKDTKRVFEGMCNI